MESRRQLGILAALAVASLSGCTTEAPPHEFGAPHQAFEAPPQMFIPPPPFPTAPTANQSPAEFNGKFVAVNYALGDEIVTTVLLSPSVKKLGGRDFLVGEVVSGDGQRRSEKKSAVAWLPIETIDSLIAFETKDQALDDASAPVGAKI